MNSMKTMIAGVLAALLLIPPAGEALAKSSKRRRVASKAKATVKASQSATQQGMAALDRKDYAGAIARFEQAVRLDKTDSGAHFLLGYAHYQRGFRSGDPETADKKDALETINAYSVALALDPKLSKLGAPYRLYHSMALSYEAIGAYDKAIDAYKKAHHAAPHNPILPLYAAKLRFRMNDMVRSAANLALSLRKGFEVGKQSQIAEMVKTDPYFSPMLKSALHQRVLSEYDPTSMKAMVASNIASGEELRDAVSSGSDQRSKILSERSKESEALRKKLALADAAFKSLKYAAAADGYEDVLALNKEAGVLSEAEMAKAHERIGVSQLRLGLAADSIKSLQLSLQAQPFNASAHYHLALAYSLTGNFSRSLRALGEAFHDAPTDGELRKYLLLAKTDSELDPVRDMPGFKSVTAPFVERLQVR